MTGRHSTSALPWYLLFGAINEVSRLVAALMVGVTIPRADLFEWLNCFVLGQHVVVAHEEDPFVMRHIGWMAGLAVALIARRYNSKHIARAATFTAMEAVCSDLLQASLLPFVDQVNDPSNVFLFK